MLRLEIDQTLKGGHIFTYQMTNTQINISPLWNTLVNVYVDLVVFTRIAGTS